jgi:hypothetical protein
VHGQGTGIEQAIGVFVMFLSGVSIR